MPVKFFIYSLIILSILILCILTAWDTLTKHLLSSPYNHKLEFITALFQIFILSISLFTTTRFISNPDIAATFISVHATIFAVNVALWALFSGVLDKNYMGISYTEYFFSMKPRIYKQKWVALTSLIVLLNSSVCYLCGYYDFVGASLVVEVIFIGVSALFLYGIFQNPKVIKSEIRQFSIMKQFERGGAGKTLLEELEDEISA